MAHEWHAGVLAKSSWHGLESVENLKTVEDMIRAGRGSLAWPTAVDMVPLLLQGDPSVKVPAQGIVATYQDGSRICHGTGKRYEPLSLDAWEYTLRQAIDAGAKPAGAFALRGGSRILATFEVPSADEQGIATYLTVLDGMDGETPHLVGASSIRVVCANTLAAAFGSNLREGDSLRTKHSKNVNGRARTMADALADAMKQGKTVREMYAQARETPLDTPTRFRRALDILAPIPELKEDGSNRAQVTRATSQRTDLLKASALGINDDGPTVATLWNAASFLVDRTPEGESRQVRGAGDMLDSLLLGTRATKVAQIQALIPVILADGSEVMMEASEAKTHGIDDRQIGAALLDDML